MKEALFSYGSFIASKYPTIDNPCKIGEENVLHGIANMCTFVTRTFTPVITLNLSRFFRVMRGADPKIILDMKMRCTLKIQNMTTIINSKLRGELLKDDMGYVTKNKRMIPEVEERAREMVGDEIVPLK